MKHASGLSIGLLGSLEVEEGGPAVEIRGAIQHEFWRQRGVDLYDVELEDFVADIEQRLGKVPPP